MRRRLTTQPWGFAEGVVFVAGISTLGAEIAAARLVSPTFGASTVVWANTIASCSSRWRAATGSAGGSPTATRTRAGWRATALVGAGLVALIPLLAVPVLDVTEDPSASSAARCWCSWSSSRRRSWSSARSRRGRSGCA